ncbi:glycosyltransferase family 4 protein [Heyndrickxia acidicola]|uniref:Glycosyltransferase family 4 protein n=1 Tax=Heyndrickxia acidicola TaxID=209389 RepID=A0ABU6MJ53_9BACI|nr:glycosyltransferase family 4 protein [Heyndrickxia acidicola]MED1204716.1 glycosyltransferase family 4 protein [Heyndrickxia acidicola]
MKVIYVRSNPVDPDSRVEKEVNSLIKLGYEVEILAWDRENSYKVTESYLDLKSGKVKIYRFGLPGSFGGGIKRNLIPLFKFQIRLYSWLVKNKSKYDVIHACDFDTAFLSSKVAKLFKKKFVYDIFDYYVDAFSVPKFAKKIIEKIDHNVINSADAVIICSEKRKEQIKGTNPKKLLVIHNTPEDVKEDLKDLNLNKTKIKIVYVGILSSGRFIKEIAEVIKNNKEYEFHIGGFGVFEDYFRELSQKNININFYGKLPYKKTLELEKSCDLMVAIYDPHIPNHYYAAPNKFYESLMLGKPLIMVKNTGMDYVVAKHNIGEVIEYNVRSLKDGIDNLVKRRSDWPGMSIKMKDLYNQNYSWTMMELRLKELYGELED